MFGELRGHAENLAVAASTVAAEQLMAAILCVEDIDLEQATRLNNGVTRLLAKLSLRKRDPKPPNLDELMAEAARKRQEAGG